MARSTQDMKLSLIAASLSLKPHNMLKYVLELHVVSEQSSLFRCSLTLSQASKWE